VFVLSKNLYKNSFTTETAWYYVGFKKRKAMANLAEIRKAFPAAVLILALLFTVVAGTQIVEVTEANFFIGPSVWIDSPSSGVVYTNTSVPLHVAAIVQADSPEIVRFLYCVDENSNVTLTNLNKTGTVGGYEFHTESVLKNLAEGNHTLKVYSQDASGEEMSGSVEFIIDTHFKSPLLVLSPKNITYTISEVPLTFVCSEEITSADYLLDGIGEGPISGNLTLAELPIGVHEITVVVWTVRGFFSQTLYFSISEPEPFPIGPVLGVTVIAIVLVCASLLLYFKKRKRGAMRS
jgi:hypothetical protein